jgi:hypothetical protein
MWSPDGTKVVWARSFGSLMPTVPKP